MTIAIFWINLKDSLNRLVFMNNQLKHLNIDNYRINAVTPSDFDSKKYHIKSTVSNMKRYKTTMKEIACMASHLIALKQGLELNNDNDMFSVCEDDISFTKKVSNDYLDTLIQDAPPDWEILQLSFLCLNDTTLRKVLSSKSKWTKWIPNVYYGTAFYIIKTHVAKKLLNTYYNSNVFDFSMVNARIQADYLIYKDTICYTLTKPISTIETSLNSTIHPQHMGQQIQCNDIIKSYVDSSLNLKKINLLQIN